MGHDDEAAEGEEEEGMQKGGFNRQGEGLLCGVHLIAANPVMCRKKLGSFHAMQFQTAAPLLLLKRERERGESTTYQALARTDLIDAA